VGLGISTAIGVGLLMAAAFADGELQGALWALALVLDVGGPLVIDSSGWKMMPQHFAERHGERGHAGDEPPTC
jgi:low temperature requirement protein LtrA